LALCLNAVNAWWDGGHIIVARIAFDLLEGSSALDKANELLSHYKKSSLERDFPFVECATYGDYIKGYGGSFQSSWHFVDTPLFDEGGDAKYWNY